MIISCTSGESKRNVKTIGTDEASAKEGHGISPKGGTVFLSVIVASILWLVMFSPWTAPRLNFWWAMTVSALVLMVIALSNYDFLNESCGKSEQRVTRCKWREVIVELLLGIVIAIALWGVFWIGDRLSSMMFDFARPQVDTIYGMKQGNSPWLIALLLLCIIGPAEELFWRGFVQRCLSVRWGADAAFVVTTLVYALVHLPSMNFMLIMAALTCGICWGGLYRLFPKHLPAIVLSHALWDAAAFVWFPI